MMKKLNLPNKLTIFRIVLVPIFIALIAVASYFENLNWLVFVALGVYIVASITDLIDGKIARKYNLITDFGKIMDPLADKILVSAGFIMLTYLKVIPGWICAIVICRDFFVDGLRMLASMKNIVVPAMLSGKIKTSFEMFTIIFALLGFPMSEYNSMCAFIENGFSMPAIPLLINVFMSVCLIGTVIVVIWSVIEYTIKITTLIKGKSKDSDKLLDSAEK